MKEPAAEKQPESHTDGGGTGEESTESEDEDSEPQPQTEVTDPAAETPEETEAGPPEEAEMPAEEGLGAA